MKLRSRRSTRTAGQMAGEVRRSSARKHHSARVVRPLRGLCSAPPGSINVEHHAFGEDVKDQQKRMSALARSFAMPSAIKNHDDIKQRAIRDMADVCVDIPIGYPEGIAEWA